MTALVGRCPRNIWARGFAAQEDDWPHLHGAIRESSHGNSFDKIDGVIWYRRQARAMGGCQGARADPRPALRELRVRGRARLWRRIFKCTEHSERLKRSAKILDFKIPCSVAEIDAAKQLVVEKNNLPDAYVRPVAWRGSEMMGVSAQIQHHPSRHRLLAVAELFRPGRAAEGHPPRPRRISPARPGDCARRSPRPPAST